MIKQKELDNEKFLLTEYNNAGNIIYIIKYSKNKTKSV